MKDLISLPEKSDIHSFVRGLWRTDVFRNSHDAGPGSFIYDQVEAFAYLPRLFARETNDHLERAHFSTWWNVFMLRDDYDNPFIHDLYYLHEFAHAVAMPYIPDIGRGAFDEKMQRNELEASVLSEITVYFELAGLRDSSFTQEIYADRFIHDPKMIRLFSMNRGVAIETIRSMRRDVMVSRDETKMDLTEKWIKRFADQNDVFGVAWAERYGEVETQMARLQQEAGGRSTRREALADYRDWIEQEAARDPIDNIPFREEAELFCPFYWATKRRYAAAMKGRGGQ